MKTSCMRAATNLYTSVSIPARIGAVCRTTCPPSRSTTLVVHERENDLVVGTHGRGVYIADVSMLQQFDSEWLSARVHLLEPEPVVQWRMVRQPAVSAQNFAGENALPAVRIAYWLGGEPNGPVSLAVHDGDRKLMDLSATGRRGLNIADWYMTRTEARTETEQAEWTEFQAMLANETEFFDYYDTVEQFPEPGEEVDRFGRSLNTRVHPATELVRSRRQVFSRWTGAVSRRSDCWRRCLRNPGGPSGR